MMLIKTIEFLHRPGTLHFRHCPALPASQYTVGLVDCPSRLALFSRRMMGTKNMDLVVMLLPYHGNEILSGISTVAKHNLSVFVLSPFVPPPVTLLQHPRAG